MQNNDEEIKPWDRQPGETARWYARFNRYRLLNPSQRGLTAAWREEIEHRTPKTSSTHGRLASQTPTRRRKPSRLPGSWFRAADKWNWVERAEAWDDQRYKEAEMILEESHRRLLAASKKAINTLIEMLDTPSHTQRRMAARAIIDSTWLIQQNKKDGVRKLPEIKVIEVIKPAGCE